MKTKIIKFLEGFLNDDNWDDKSSTTQPNGDMITWGTFTITHPEGDDDELQQVRDMISYLKRQHNAEEDLKIVVKD